MLVYLYCKYNIFLSSVFYNKSNGIRYTFYNSSTSKQIIPMYLHHPLDALKERKKYKKKKKPSFLLHNYRTCFLKKIKIKVKIIVNQKTH